LRTTIVDSTSGLLRLTPAHDHSSNVMLIAHRLIRAQRAFDRLLPDQGCAQGLENLASAIQAIPVLPDYRPPASQQASAPRQRRSRRNGSAGPDKSTDARRLV
jgi:hypothetical protein